MWIKIPKNKQMPLDTDERCPSINAVQWRYTYDLRTGKEFGNDNFQLLLQSGADLCPVIAPGRIFDLITFFYDYNTISHYDD